MKRAAGAVAVALFLAGSAVAAAARPPLVAAHRGGAALWPENSLTAFRGALALGVDALEFDLHLTADGVPVVIHDATLDRTTTGRGAVRATTLEALRRVRLLDRRGARTEDRVPTLAEVLDVARTAAAEILPEIKLDVARARYPGVEARVLELLRARGMLARATIQSFDEATLREVRALEPAARTMLLVSRVRVAAYAARPADAVRWALGVGDVELGVDYRVIDAELVAAARAAGLRLAAWTVNTDTDLLTMAALGVDLVMTDHPDRARRLLVKP
jgi:glycerophosphoryl diester phosphodiesterase